MTQVEEALIDTTMENPARFADFVKDFMGPLEFPIHSDETVLIQKPRELVVPQSSIGWSNCCQPAVIVTVTEPRHRQLKIDLALGSSPVFGWDYEKSGTTDSSVVTAGTAGVAVRAKKVWSLSFPRYLVVQEEGRGISFDFSAHSFYSDFLMRDSAFAAITRIRELGTYSAGWDCPDTVAPSVAAINDAEQFISNHDFTSMHFPSIGAADDGEINFWWDVDSLYIDLGFFGDGTYSFYARLPNGKEITMDQVPVFQPLHPEILKFLKKFD